MARSAGLWLLALMACSSAPVDERPGASASAIVSGARDDGDPAVVALASAAGVLVCTGTLVAPRVVATAAHCLADPRPPSVVFGPAVTPGARSIAVAGARVHPQYDAWTHAHDVAVVFLDSAVTDVAPIVPLPAPGAIVAGAPVRIVGYGGTSGSDLHGGAKNTGAAVVASATDADFTFHPTPSQTCHGDSGGPALVTVAGREYLAGVTSDGDPACGSWARDVRVDAESPFFAGVLASTQPGAASVGDACAFDEMCASGACAPAADDPELKFCTSPCARDADCPSPTACAAGRCVHPAPSPGARGARCDGDGECATRVCAGAPGARVCTTACLVSGPSSCAEGSICRTDPAETQRGACFVDAPVTATRGCAASGAASRGDAKWLVAIAALAFSPIRRARRRSSKPPAPGRTRAA